MPGRVLGPECCDKGSSAFCVLRAYEVFHVVGVNLQYGVSQGPPGSSKEPTKDENTQEQARVESPYHP